MRTEPYNSNELNEVKNPKWQKANQFYILQAFAKGDELGIPRTNLVSGYFI